jgi:hypothetical protein
MTRDLGVRARRRLSRGERIVRAAALTLAVAIPAAVLTGSLLKNRREAIASTIDGPPCPTLSRASYEAQPVKALKAIEYGGVVLARHAGHVNCSPVTYDGGRGFGTFPVRQFTSPGVLKVTTRKGAFFFAPGVGQAATVSAPRGVARCVLASKFRLN